MKSYSSTVFNLFTLLALLVSLISSAVTVTPVYAAGIAVNSNADTVANDGFCTLREAIINANGDNQSGAADCPAGSGADTITFAANYTITLAGSQLPSITTQIVINGNGVAHTIIQANASPKTATYRVFEVGSSGNLTLNDVTVQNGSCSGACASQPGNGGGILNQGALSITNSLISNNSASNGGGIFALGTGKITVLNSSISGNTASSDGGGIFIFATNLPTITNSAFYNNSASTLGGGIHIASTHLVVQNSAFSGNRTIGGAGILDLGGGIFAGSGSTLSVQNSTFSGNSSKTGGSGLAVFGGAAVAAINSIFANSVSGSNCYATVLNGGNNIDDGTSCNFGSSNGSMSSTNPLLGPLMNNGGPTQTHALMTGSPAIDGVTYNAPNSAPATDQRGINRPQGAGYDIGAFEVRDVNPPVVTQISISTLGTLLESQAVALGITQIVVRFNQDVTSGGGATAADNPTNYLLVRAGGNGIQTTSCKVGVAGSDIKINIDSVVYTNNGGSGPFEATLNVNGGTALPAGTYMLFVCGTTSITNIFGEELNGGWDDYDLGFSVLQGTTTAGTTGGTTGGATGGGQSGSGGTSNLVQFPNTGFAPNRITSLPPQPANFTYSKLSDLWLEIPALKVKTDIVGVTQSENAWDVSWLGNNAGWLNGTAYPTWAGNSVITGHVYNANGLPGIFVGLKDLKQGDQIIVHMGGEKHIFEVRSAKLVRPDTTAFAFEHLDKNSYLTLITCAGYNEQSDSYRFRRVVRAVLISVQAE